VQGLGDVHIDADTTQDPCTHDALDVVQVGTQELTFNIVFALTLLLGLLTVTEIGAEVFGQVGLRVDNGLLAPHIGILPTQGILTFLHGNHLVFDVFGFECRLLFQGQVVVDLLS